MKTETEHDTGCKRPLRIPIDVHVSADFAGPNNCYRTRLMHRWGNGPLLMFAMMNPSDAGMETSDSTVAKCSTYARLWGYGGILVGNACAYRATQQSELLKVANPVGMLYNNPALAAMLREADMIILAHGRFPKKLQYATRNLVDVLSKSGKPLHVLRESPDGNPWHPLYLPLNLKPAIWSKSQHQCEEKV